MELNSKEYQIYKNINFANRYESLSNSFQFEDGLEYTNELVLRLINSLGYKAKYLKNNDFFKIEKKINEVKFYLHICLKYNNVELIIGATDLKNDLYITGSVFGRLYELIKLAEGIDLKENIRDPKFRSYNDLKVILEEVFSICKDFKNEVLKTIAEV
jgi:hypothetical protein